MKTYYVVVGKRVLVHARMCMRVMVEVINVGRAVKHREIIKHFSRLQCKSHETIHVRPP